MTMSLTQSDLNKTIARTYQGTPSFLPVKDQKD